MAECVFDASFIGYANDPLDEVNFAPGTLLRRRVTALETVTSGRSRLRCNPKLIAEYDQLVKVHRNDMIEQFIALLDSEQTIKLKSSTLRRQDKVKATDCGWPTHDQHVLAAAVGGTDVVVHVTEGIMGVCAPKVWRIFRIRVNFVA
jgi:hypothetical protein